MAEKSKGGRGKVVPYESKPIRTPTPLVDQHREMLDFYREHIEAGGDPDNPPRYVFRPLPKDPRQRLMDMLDELD